LLSEKGRVMPPKVDPEKCTGCGTCVNVCPATPTVFEIKDDKSVVANPDACIECGACAASCPTGAITLE